MKTNGGRVIVAVVVIVIALIRLRLADAPIERDEGEYAYAGQLILDGVPPYAVVYNMKFPGTYYAYSLVLALFGQSSWGVHAGLLARDRPGPGRFAGVRRRNCRCLRGNGDRSRECTDEENDQHFHDGVHRALPGRRCRRTSARAIMGQPDAICKRGVRRRGGGSSWSAEGGHYVHFRS